MLFLFHSFKLQREIDVKKGKFISHKDSWFDLETNGDNKPFRLKADEKMYDQWKAKLENAFKKKEPTDKFSSDERDSTRK